MPKTSLKPPSFLDPVPVEIPDLPESLVGFTILHVSDLHVTGPRQRYEQVIAVAAAGGYDLLALTGDYMNRPGDEPLATEMVARLLREARPRLEKVGVFGNHDSQELRRQFASLPIRWLDNAAWVPPLLPLSLLGVNCSKNEHNAPTGDLAAAMLDDARQRADEQHHCRILLSHMPTWLPAAGAMGVDLMLCGHTHAGQCRLPWGPILHNATPRWPLNLSSGMLQCQSTQCVVSRGLGEVYVQGLRMFCKPQLPLITLYRPTKPFIPTEKAARVRNW